MMDKNKYQNKYRIQTTRLQNWDYSSNATYFVTICTKDKRCWFGDVKDGVVLLSDIGQLVKNYWLEIPNHFQVKLGEFTIMPNHIHGIIIIDKNNDVVETLNLSVSTGKNIKIGNNIVETPNLGVPTASGKKWKQGTLGVIINQFKRICTIKIRNIEPNFQWQSRFYEHIIRNERSYNKIVEYILNNSIKWELDEYYEKNY